MRALAVRFEESETDVSGVVALHARGTGDFQSRILDVERQGAPTAIRFSSSGAVFVAEQVLRTVGGAADCFRATVGFGPRARRRYVRLTERVVEGLVVEAEVRTFPRAMAPRSVAKAEETAALALAFIDLLPTGGAS